MKARKLAGNIPITKDLKLLIIIGGLYSISAALSNTFVNIYLWKQTGNFVDISIYNLTVVFFQPITFILAGKMSKAMDRVIIFRIGVAFLTLFYSAVLFSGSRAADLIVLLGAIQGVGYGFYWLSYNVLTFEITEPENRDFFNGFLGIISSLGGMIGPFLAGFIITHTGGDIGYSIIFAISLALFAVAVILSFFISRRTAKGKYYFLRILKELKYDRNWRNITAAHVFQGLREGTFVFVVSLYVFIVTGSELALGTFGLLNAGVGMVAYYFAAKLIKKNQRNKAILIGVLGLFFSVFLLIFDVTYAKLIAYGVSIALFYPILLVPYVSLTYDVIGRSWKAAEMRVEYIVIRDVFLNVGRIISVLIFLVGTSLFKIESIMPYLLVLLGSGHLFIYFCVRRIAL